MLTKVQVENFEEENNWASNENIVKKINVQIVNSKQIRSEVKSVISARKNKAQHLRHNFFIFGTLKYGSW